MTDGKAGDERFYQGVEYFNRQDFFNAHEAWEDLWLSTTDDSRGFLQGLIQWALALYHFQRGNMRGSRSLFESGCALLAPYEPVFQGLDLAMLKNRMQMCLAEVLEHPPERLAGKKDGPELLRFGADPEKLPAIKMTKA